MRKKGSGGARPNSGVKPPDGIKKIPVAFSIHPAIADAFKSKYGRGSSSRVQQLMQEDLHHQVPE